MQRQIFNYAIQVFNDLAMQEDILDHQSTKFNELLQLLSKEDTSHRLIDLLNMLKE